MARLSTEELIKKNEEEIAQQEETIKQAQEKIKQLKKTGKRLLEKKEQEEQQSMLNLLKANNITKSKDLEKIIEELKTLENGTSSENSNYNNEQFHN
jgi:GTP:adenosylcobinamide-phosphate guanylyltransferase